MLSKTISSRTTLLSIAIGLSALLSGCQLVAIKEKNLNQVISSKADNILTNNKLSQDTASILHILEISPQQCKQDFAYCSSTLEKHHIFSADERYAALSELYLARALDLAQQKNCQTDPNTKIISPKLNDCLENSLTALDHSLRYSYAYLFKTEDGPRTRVFDQRQMHVRSFYNVALSRLMHIAYQRAPSQPLPAQFNIANRQYQLNLDHYPELKTRHIDYVQSSYNLNFSGFYKINRQDGLGAEFIVITQADATHKNEFILDPIKHYQHQANPNIHRARYLSVTAIAQPLDPNSSVEDIISGKAELKIDLYNPYQYKTVAIDQQNYALTANYSVPFAFWLAENDLGMAAYWTLLDRTEHLRMPHVYMLEPYQPNKKIVVLIHGLASSPETWIRLTNNILGDKTLRENYQIWQVFYSTNMPIIESRFQIHALLQQAFAQVEPHSISAQDAVLIGHSMGGIISRLLVSQQDISPEAIPRLSYEQYTRLQQNPVIKERFQFNADLPFTRAIFVAAPHRGSDLTNRWYVELAKKLVKLPKTFFEQVDIQLNGSNSTQGMVQSGPDDLSPQSRFMQLTKHVMPKTNIPYHSIIGNNTKSKDINKMTDGIVPYLSSHLENAVSEKVIKGGHSIHEEPETLLELRRILHQHLKQD